MCPGDQGAPGVHGKGTCPGDEGAVESEAGQARVEAAGDDLERAHGGRGDDAEDEADVQRNVVVPEGYAQALPQARRVPASARAHASGEGSELPAVCSVWGDLHSKPLILSNIPIIEMGELLQYQRN